MTRRDDNDVFDVQHLTGKDIGEIEDALNTDDFEIVVSVVDAIVGAHLSKLRKHGVRR